MSENRRALAGVSADEAVAHVMNNDISDLLDQAQVVRQTLPAHVVTAQAAKLLADHDAGTA